MSPKAKRLKDSARLVLLVDDNDDALDQDGAMYVKTGPAAIAVAQVGTRETVVVKAQAAQLQSGGRCLVVLTNKASTLQVVVLPTSGQYNSLRHAITAHSPSGNSAFLNASWDRTDSSRHTLDVFLTSTAQLQHEERW
jgi:hypothetical protein